ncbi:synaptonemal complex protein 1-like [Fopius arisanus]|uniref:Synaptonemal complex protein 1-like n=1 Tax=Fopius arisanus TaxID=64838 RepID=A0A9R1T6Q9_9HYME|nr:PREDICTED: synaptonemal complex protein 1-like [Fopius arisanus]
MEMESYADEDLERRKRKLFETAEGTLVRLNETINDMKSWNRERDILTSDIYRLKIALGYSERLLGDPLVMHQSQEIHRLERMNNDMRMKVQSMSVALMNAQRTISWNVERKVRCGMATVKCQVAEEKLHLAQEIARLRSKLNEAEVDGTMYHEIRGKLDEYREGDRLFDDIIARAARKLIDTVFQMSSQLIKVGQVKDKGDVFENIAVPEKSLTDKIDRSTGEIPNELNVSLEKDRLLKEMQEKIHKILMEKELKASALKRLASSLRTKLIISLRRNKKLSEKLSDTEGSKNIEEKWKSVEANVSGKRLSDAVDDTKGKIKSSNEELITLNDNCKDSYDVECLNEELMKVIEEKEKLVDQLEVERITTREALREFEKSVKETERKAQEIKLMEINSSITSKYINQLKNENRGLKKLRSLQRAEILNKKFFCNKINILRARSNRLTMDLKMSEEELMKRNREFYLVESDRNSVRAENLILEKRAEENEEVMKKLEAEMVLLKCESNDDQGDDQRDDERDDERNDESVTCGGEIQVTEGEGMFESLKLSGLEPTNSRAIEPANTEDMSVPRRAKTSLEDLQVSYDVKHVAKGSGMLVSTVSPIPGTDLSMNQGESTSIGNTFGNFSPMSGTEGIYRPDKHPLIIDEGEPYKLEVRICRSTGGDDADVNDDRGRKNKVQTEGRVRGKFSVGNQFSVPSTPEIIMRNFEETDRELSSMKFELSSVMREIDALKKELESRRLSNRLLEMENLALKEEVGRIRGKIRRVEEENRKLIKLRNTRGKF